MSERARRGGGDAPDRWWVLLTAVTGFFVVVVVAALSWGRGPGAGDNSERSADAAVVSPVADDPLAGGASSSASLEVSTGDAQETSDTPGRAPVEGLDVLVDQLREGESATMDRLLGRPEGLAIDESVYDEVVSELATTQLDLRTVDVVDEEGNVVTVEGSTSTGDWLFHLVRHGEEWRIALTEGLQ